MCVTKNVCLTRKKRVFAVTMREVGNQDVMNVIKRREVESSSDVLCYSIYIRATWAIIPPMLTTSLDMLARLPTVCTTGTAVADALAAAAAAESVADAEVDALVLRALEVVLVVATVVEVVVGVGAGVVEVVGTGVGVEGGV